MQRRAHKEKFTTQNRAFCCTASSQLRTTTASIACRGCQRQSAKATDEKPRREARPGWVVYIPEISRIGMCPLVPLLSKAGPRREESPARGGGFRLPGT